MKKSNINPKDYKIVFPSGVCRMGNLHVTYYRINGNHLWFDKKAIELVLTGKNQHNLLGQANDPKNHSKIFDSNRNEVIEIISNKGVQNYLEKARSVREENRYDFYYGVKNIGKSCPDQGTEPIQMPILNPVSKEEVKPLISITQKDGMTEISSAMEGTGDDRNNRVVQMLLNAASDLMAGKITVKVAA